MGRLIDEDDVVKEIAISTYDLMDEEDNEQLIDDIRLFVQTAQPKPQWIPCSERRPHYSETVIVSILDDTGDCNLNYTDVGWITHDGTWIVDNDENNMVTAWMPLPAPWRGEMP